MRKTLIASAAILLVTIIGLGIYFYPFQTQAEPEISDAPASPNSVCLVSENYIEHIDENNFTMLKLLSMLHSEQSPLDKSELFGTHYSLLLSTRHYHEELAQDLPACARPLNQAYIQTITATQDVLALRLAEQTHPEQPRYKARIEKARQHLNEQWGLLSDTS